MPGAGIFVERGDGDPLCCGGPVAGHLAVQETDGPERAALVVRTVPVLRRKHDIAALVTDEVFVEGRQQDAAVFPESPRAGVVREEELPSTPALRMEPVAQQGDAPPAVVEAQAAPPREVLQRRRLAVAEVFAGKSHQDFVALDLDDHDRQIVAAMYSAIQDLERIGDHAENIVEYVRTIIDENLTFSDTAMGEMRDISDKCRSLMELSFAMFNAQGGSPELIERIIQAEDSVDDCKDDYKQNHIQRMNKGECNAEAGTTFLNSMLYSVCSVLLCTLLCTMASYVLSRNRRR